VEGIRGLLPIFVDVTGEDVLVVGGGAVGARKAALLARRGARVTVVSTLLSPAMASLVESGEADWVESPFDPSRLDGRSLVFAATNDPAVNDLVSRECRARKIPVNVADDPARCSFLLPAVSEGEEYAVAVSTGGRNPGAAKAVREFLDDHRQELSVRVERGRRRRRLRGEGGTVYIVGAGPGDPDLLTVRALGLIRGADVVIHDYLVPEAILSLAPEGVPRICYARRGATVGHGARIKQEAIHEAMVRHAREGKAVVRLKSGDPLVFGRGGEEAEFLASEGIPYEIVPGISAAVGCAAAARIPLTHRDLSSSVTFVAGHRKGEDGGPFPDAASLPKDGTVAVYMGVSQGAEIAAAFLRSGWSGTTPFAVVENGCRPGQRIVAGTLDRLARVLAGKEVRSPAILFVGASAVSVPGSAAGGEDRLPGGREESFPPETAAAGGGRGPGQR
jgi:uroporphyrin-III C-methyltransferase/precorrin-2 dehydrogenase/sirohydrochlorin ferrochelatase